MKVCDINPLVVIPSYIAAESDLGVLDATLRTLRGTAFDSVDVLVVDDYSPLPDAWMKIKELTDQWDCELHLKPENTGFSKTVNVGLQRALEEGRHAILCNADIEFRHPGWVEKMVYTKNIHHPTGYAWVVGSFLTFPNGLIQHAGIYFSLLTRSFDHLWKFAPENLEDAWAFRCVPVTGALQFIRHECLESIGLYDETFSMAFEDVDYCLQVFMAGQECVFNPTVQAYHHESLFRGRSGGSEKVREWTRNSLLRLMEKWKHQSMAGLVPQW